MNDKTVPAKSNKRAKTTTAINEELSSLHTQTGIDFRVVSPTDLVFNDYNPNAMESEVFTSLAEQIEEEGGVSQTVLVRPHPSKPGKFEVVDGEHRAKGAQVAGLKGILVAVVPYDDAKGKLKTLSMNHLRGESVPIKLAKLIVDLQKDYTIDEIARFTGLKQDRQIDVLKLLEVPDFSDNDDAITISTEEEQRPVEVSIMLMPGEKQEYEDAMIKAMSLVGADVTPLVGDEVIEFDKAMKAAYGLRGVKLRNLALATICKAFNELPESMLEKVANAMNEATGMKSKRKKAKVETPGTTENPAEKKKKK